MATWAAAPRPRPSPSAPHGSAKTQSSFDLPDRDFRIVVVDLHGSMIEPKQLEEISKLEHVRELYIPGTGVESSQRREGSFRRRILPVLPGNEAP